MKTSPQYLATAFLHFDILEDQYVINGYFARALKYALTTTGWSAYTKPSRLGKYHSELCASALLRLSILPLYDMSSYPKEQVTTIPPHQPSMIGVDSTYPKNEGCRGFTTSRRRWFGTRERTAFESTKSRNSLEPGLMMASARSALVPPLHDFKYLRYAGVLLEGPGLQVPIVKDDSEADVFQSLSNSSRTKTVPRPPLALKMNDRRRNGSPSIKVETNLFSKLMISFLN
ncbi:hypothetical protein EDD18DRAFT_1108888 [Armillaria luteobubalina]|uniref:Uncharacterized protein n=1 Tax=Armillaria luteobubalina TaxID=153913 RepID=A0AA39Q0G3_9AGAR|nr:hypothetical protein EDD18DRAFT_1108888 [Armillaria luteobubalina]